MIISTYARKIVDGAKALDDLFQNALNPSSTFDKNYYQRLITKYDLTDNQKKRIEVINKRLINAMKVIDHLKDRYECDTTGRITDAKKLYLDVYPRFLPDDPRPDKVIAETIPFGLIFYVGKEFMEDDAAGQMKMTLYNMELVDDKIISENKFHLFGGLESLTMKIRDDAGRFGFNTKEHEIKHLIDSFIQSPFFFPHELSAKIYAGDLTNLSFEQDIFNETIREFNRRVSIEDLKLKDEHLKSKLLGILGKDGAITKKMQCFPNYKLIAVNYTLGNAVTSYIVATTPLKKLEERLDLITQYFLD